MGTADTSVWWACIDRHVRDYQQTAVIIAVCWQWFAVVIVVVFVLILVNILLFVHILYIVNSDTCIQS